MNNLFPATMLFALLLFPLSLSAQSATRCPMTADDANCVRVVACIGDKGVWFNGRAFGRGEGTFSGTTSTGLMCEGKLQGFWKLAPIPYPRICGEVLINWVYKSALRYLQFWPKPQCRTNGIMDY